MKTTTHETPRFTCRLARSTLAILGDTTAGEPRGPGAGHVAACADCQEFFSACNELDHALKRDAVRAWQEAPIDLEQKILHAVNRAAPQPARRESRVGTWSLSAAVACAALAVMLYRPATPPTASPTTSTAPRTENAAGATNGVVTKVDPSVLALARQWVAAVPTDLFAEMQPKAVALLQQDPYQTEVNAVKSDARTAMRFLAANFLPAAADGE